jgi:transketolase
MCMLSVNKNAQPRSESPLPLQAVAGAPDLAAEVASAEVGRRPEILARIATDVRATVVRTIGKARFGHIGGDLSVTDILTTLFFGVLRVRPEEPGWPDRDRLILSKGHCAVALYSVLALDRFFPPAALETFVQPLSPLNGHPNRRKVPGVEANTGALGHGLPFGVGCAVAARLAGSQRRVFVVLGDGELQEGSNWEAALAAGHRGLGNLTAVVDRNGLQQGARTEATSRMEPLAEKWRAFGWEAVEIDGHDHRALLEVFTRPHDGRPRCVVAHTIKGKGVSFIEDRVEWHHKVPGEAQVVQALRELGR